MPERLLQIEEPNTRLTQEIEPSDIQSRLEEINSLQNDLYQLETTIIHAQLSGSEQSQLLMHLDELTRFSSLLELRLIDLHQAAKKEEQPTPIEATLDQEKTRVFVETIDTTEAEQEEQTLDDLTEQIDAPWFEVLATEVQVPPINEDLLIEAPNTNQELTEPINKTEEESIPMIEVAELEEPVINQELEQLQAEQAQAFALAGQWHRHFHEQASSIQSKISAWLNTQAEAEERIRELEHSIQAILSEEMQLDGTIFSADQLLDGAIEAYIQQRLQTIQTEREQLETAYEQAQQLGRRERIKATTALDEALTLLQTNQARYLQRLRRLPNIKAHFEQRLAEPGEELQQLINMLKQLGQQQDASKQALAKAHHHHQEYRSHALMLGQYFETVGR